MELENIRLGTILEDAIVADILLQQPVECLLRLKCISKSWCSFISSNKFVKAHLQKLLKSDTALTQYKTFLISGRRKRYSIDHYTVDWLFRQRSLIFWPFDERFSKFAPLHPIDDDVRFGSEHAVSNPLSDFKPRVISCCNGLCCMLIRPVYDIILWNPSTRKSYKLPAIPEYPWITNIWFGYDESNDDYKVLIISGRLGIIYRGFSLYSLKKNSWKTVCNFRGPDPYKVEGVFVEGKLHCINRTFAEQSTSEIIAFDFEREAVEFVEQPRSGSGVSLLGVLHGCLCVICNWKDVWVMKEYGVKESWCRLATIPLYFSDIPNTMFCDNPDRVFSPLFVWQDGKMLFYRESSLLVYSPNDKRIRRLLISKVIRLGHIGVYIPSLVSPFPDTAQE